MELEIFKSKVLTIRGQQVMLDFDVALALDVETSKLNENAKTSVKWEYLRTEGIETQYRFQLTPDEFDIMMSENQISSKRKISSSIWAYTRRGCAFFGTSMNNPKACDLAIQLADVFVKHLEHSYLDAKDDPFMISLARIADLRMKQLQLEAEVRMVARLEIETRDNVKDMQTRLDNMNGDSGYATVLAYLRNRNLNLPLNLCKEIGKEAANICRCKEINIGRVPDERWGTVNSYPIVILDEIIENFL